jgi:hypothetical protein
MSSINVLYVYGFTIVTSLYSIVKMEGIEHLWMTLLICCSTIPAHVLCLIFAHKFRFGIVSSNDHGSLPFYVYLFVCLLYHWQEVSQISQYQMCLIRSRNCLPFIAHGFTSFWMQVYVYSGWNTVVEYKVISWRTNKTNSKVDKHRENRRYNQE